MLKMTLVADTYNYEDVSASMEIVLSSEFTSVEEVFAAFKKMFFFMEYTDEQWRIMVPDDKYDHHRLDKDRTCSCGCDNEPSENIDMAEFHRMLQAQADSIMDKVSPFED